MTVAATSREAGSSRAATNGTARSNLGAGDFSGGAGCTWACQSGADTKGTPLRAT